LGALERRGQSARYGSAVAGLVFGIVPAGLIVRSILGE